MFFNSKLMKLAAVLKLTDFKDKSGHLSRLVLKTPVFKDKLA